MKLRALSGPFAAMCLLPAMLAAQTTPFDAAAYTRARAAATRIFLDAKRPTPERLAQLEKMGYPDDATQAAFLRLGANKSEDGAIRLEALHRYPYGNRYLDVVLGILDDHADGSEELDAALIVDLSKRAVTVPPVVVRQRIQATLRKLMDDSRDEVRLNAFRALVANHDQVAANVLDESLRRGAGVPIPIAEAINLMNEDGAIGHFNAIRPYLQSNDAAVQAMAAHSLAADQESRPRIVRLATSADTPLQTRLLALRGLASEDKEFVSYATGLVEDEKTDPKIRDASMTAIVGRMNYYAVPTEQQLRFARAVEKLAAEPGPKSDSALKAQQTAEKLKPYLRQAFPEIRKYYENR